MDQPKIAVKPKTARKRLKSPPKRKPPKRKPGQSKSPIDALAQALAKQPKAVLIDALVSLARQDPTLQRNLLKRFRVELSAGDLVAATRAAISDATDFDERAINTNFDYDYEAYATVKQNLGKLIRQGDLEVAMELCLELMKDGSYQAEMSDEGMMTYELEECFQVVAKAIERSKLSTELVLAWSAAMRRNDRIACIFDEGLAKLRKRFGSKSPG